MRIIEWNCEGGDKLHRLPTLRPDIAVVCEAAPTAAAVLAAEGGTSPTWLFAGEAPRGLAIVGFTTEVRERPEAPGAGRLSLAAELDDGSGVLAIHSVRGEGSRRRYGDEVLAAVDAHAEWIATGRVIVAGDFNIDARGVGNGSRGAQLFMTIADKLRDLGLESAYHAASGEPYGSELAMTYYRWRKRAQTFHLDYCFVPVGWTIAAEVGQPDEWLTHSDHVPLIVDAMPSTLPAFG